MLPGRGKSYSFKGSLLPCPPGPPCQQVWDSDVPGPHGVSPTHSTFALVAGHARRVARFNAAAPPRAECGLGCWAPQPPRLGGLLRRCAATPDACGAAEAGGLRGGSQQVRLRAQQEGVELRLAGAGSPTYPSYADCCRAGLGAFARGCSIP